MRLHMTLLGMAIATGAFGATAHARESWVTVDSYCGDGGDKESFSCEQDGQVLGTVSAERSWDSRWPTPSNNNWSTHYSSRIVVDKGLECVSKAIRIFGSDYVLDAGAGCSAHVTWGGWWSTGRDQPDFIQGRTDWYGFGNEIEQGNPWVPEDGGYHWLDMYDFPANLRVDAISCACSALVVGPD